MEYSEYKMLNGYPLDLKVEKTKARVHEFARKVGEGNMFVSFSGGKDSTVLLDIVRQEYPKTKAVFCDTGLEYPEVKEFVRNTENVEIIKPKKNFKEVINEYGYPVISKEQSKYIWDIRHGSEKMRNVRLNGNPKGGFKLSKKWYFCLDAPFEISDKCCNYIKKSPLASYERKTGSRPIVGQLASESAQRMTMYLKSGCNSFNPGREKSNPIGFWGEQDILAYIKEKKLPYAKIYGDIRERERELYFTGCQRTGCIYCAYGAHREESPNRFERLKVTHPKLYEYCIGGGEYRDGKWKPSKDGLGFAKVLDYLNIKY